MGNVSSVVLLQALCVYPAHSECRVCDCQPPQGRSEDEGKMAGGSVCFSWAACAFLHNSAKH